MNKNTILNNNRYRLYREHKYIFYYFSEILQLTASLDFNIKESIAKLKKELESLQLLLESHAEYEESRIHQILKNKNSLIFHQAEKQHQHQKNYFTSFYSKINLIEEKIGQEDAHFLGYELYLELRNFFSKNLDHFDYEERIIMPELQRLLTDGEIRDIERITYNAMTAEQMVNMMEVLFPHMNPEDRLTFLKDIKDCEPEKFVLAWSGIASSIQENERAHLIKILDIK